MKNTRFIIPAICFFASVAFGAPGADDTPKTYQFNGRAFLQARHLEEGPVETFEYVRKGENLTNWTELVTHQRVTATGPLDQIGFRADSYVQFLREQLARDNSAQPTQWNLLYSSKDSAAFLIRFNATDAYSAQVMVGLVLAGGSNTINVVQWALKTDAVDADTGSKEQASWVDLLVKQAREVGATKPAALPAPVLPPAGPPLAK